MLLLVSSFNCVSLFISLEGLSLCLYTLAAYDFQRRTSSEAAIKYFTIGAMASGILLFGVILVFGKLHSTSFIDLGLFLSDLQLNQLPIPFSAGIGSLFIFYGLLFKLGG